MKKSTSAWIELASRDLEAARKLLPEEYLANIVLFHTQQCIEKCMKGILEEKNLTVPKIHGVIKLYELILKNTNITLPITDDELDLIDDVYIDTRYPGSLGLLPSGFPSKAEAEELFAIAEKVHKATIKTLKT